MRRVIGAFVVALLSATSAAAEERLFQPPVHCPPAVNWRWIVQPDNLQYSLLIGQTASSSAKAGDYGIAQCEVSKTLKPTNCTALWESPHSNLGEFVIKLSKYYKAASKDDAGQPTEGRKFCFAFGLSGHSAAP